jgi:glycine cleavage system H protein
MAEIPPDLRYTNDHEWAKVTQGNTVRVGITDFAQSSLGDIVFVSVHGIDSTVESGDTFGEVESTKSVSDLYAPVPGSVVARNEALDEQPELLNTDPYRDRGRRPVGARFAPRRRGVRPGHRRVNLHLALTLHRAAN